MSSADSALPSSRALELPVASPDGHRASLLARIPASPKARLLWLPALGIAAKHYQPFAEALAALSPGLLAWFGWGSLFRDAQPAAWVLDTLLAYLFGIAFQYYAIKPMGETSAATALAAATVALSKGAVSKAPNGPFHTTV